MPDAPYRVAVYYAPAAADPLWAACCAWLGRDPESGAPRDQPDVVGVAGATGSPGHYGAHATLKPPMMLRGGYEDFVSDVERLSLSLHAFEMPRLEVVRLKTFLALCPVSASAPLNALAARCVIELDHHRLPEDEASRAKRAAGRTPSELENLARWGYPLVLQDWNFHITLCNSGAAGLLPAAQTYFAPALAQPRMFESLAIFREDEPGADFRLAKRIGLSGCGHRQ